ncbi:MULTISPECIES: hypothetical protein [Pseudoalteromonas]|uniref:Uncharacterized protein n=1 Tax=Pseudoalteromonas fuliginea TaxID=1872678 RepID=A0ABD3Y8C2_9GAMM|nr:MULTISPECIES: hypothetical protein [Pseudoalteromonas]KDC50712.1 hypothetical protein DC53_11605 [Pseudoalteromonas fuliginea]KJZ28941.1 hypothetical protein TW82_04775 [Pseudoalteromonas fuliginea]GAA80105.1 hypothetical protein P20495_2617 [Pseudoalteromonas sp. BSi20495]
MKIFKTRYVIGFLLFSSVCCAQQDTEVKINKSEIDIKTKYEQLEKHYQSLETQLKNLHQSINVIQANNTEIANHTSGLAIDLVNNRKNISQNKQDIQLNVSQNSWGSFLLACVAVIVTVLGVGIALLAFWGYRNIKTASVDASVKDSIMQSEAALTLAIENGDFNNVINSAVERAVYRGILSTEDFPDYSEDA